MTALPGQFFAMLHAYVSMQRIERYLAEEEVPAWVSAFSVATASELNPEVGFSEAIFEWQPKKGPDIPDGFRLGPLDFTFPIGKVSLISGATGSGKSAILAALLGGLEHATIRDNIIFGSAFGFDETRYQTVIEACALKRDLEVFDAGDLTEIGEKGITLSGGQRARIALARALYSQARVILLDDPLAAVDMHTAQHLVNNCFASELVRGRTVILVTHHIGICLPISSYLVELSHGGVIRKGRIQEIEEKVLQKVIEIEDKPFTAEDHDDLPVPEEMNEADVLHDSRKLHRKHPFKSKDGKLVEAEARAEGRVSLKTYLTYIRAAGIMSWVFTLLLMLAIRAINIGNQMARYYSHRSNLKQVAWLYIRLAPPYIRASRDLRRLESISLSPAFAGFDELLRGLAHIRAFGMEKRYQNSFYAKVDKFQSFDHCYWLVNCWLRWRYDCLGSVIVLLSTLFALWMKVRDGSTAIVIVQAGVFAEASRQLVRVAAQLELDFNSVERVIEYLDIPQEAPAIIEDHRPPAFWPSNSGKLVVENLSVKYAPALPAVLRNLSFSIEPSEKIGVVGRTGSGKSTLAMSLLRIIEPVGGRIIIDGIDISTIGLEDLRKRITIVSQDVSLFSGTLRSNLDPMEEHSPEECTEVMKRCHLDSVIVHKENDRNALLNMPVNQGSLSGGERQLVALSRAILRGTNVIIMDEATSQIDAQLDENIQKTIREELGGAIVITIAHRLKTIIDYDRILVLDDGEIAEFGTPKELLNKDGGVFKEMCRKSPDWTNFKSLIS
ncbi:hypothetical protein HHX47_DHR1001186 [Lentinula edodes]|nr:hypothetical protein HHX47_DHR1001186 [Lentinula edodes]